jgi:zinc protease
MKNTWIGLGLVLFLAGCASSPSPSKTEVSGGGAVKSEDVPLVGSFHVHRYVLENGLKLLVVEDHSSPTFAYQTWFNVGSRDEVHGYTGLAHLFEHLMFKATTHHPEGDLDHILEGSGVEDENAFTSWDYTAYVQELPKDKLELIAQLESDRMVNLVVNDASFKTEREVVQNERRYRTENSPDGTLQQIFFEEAFQTHPYHWPVIGYQQDLDAMTAQQPRDFYHAYYSPNHAAIVVVGDVDSSEVLKVVQKYYGSYQAQTTPPHEIPAEPEQTSPRRKTVPLNIQVEKLLIGYKIPNLMSPDMPALYVLDALLTGGKSSRLYRALVDTGIAANVGTNPNEQKDPSLFTFECNLQEKKKAAVAEAVILRELKKLSNDLVPESEMERAKNRIQFSFFQGLEGNGEKANFLGRYESTTGNFENGLKIQEQAKLVKPSDIQAVVQKYFSPNNRTVITGTIK